jgi:hypothetical protein
MQAKPVMLLRVAGSGEYDGHTQETDTMPEA